jgi:hypothetical protein
MGAIALPKPHQLYLLPPPPAPAVREADVRRVAWQLSRLYFDDALLCGNYALERLKIPGSYIQFVLYYRERVVGVVEVRGRCAAIRRDLARLLLAQYDWRVDAVRRVPYGAITNEGVTFERTRRLLKGNG